MYSTLCEEIDEYDRKYKQQKIDEGIPEAEQTVPQIDDIKGWLSVFLCNKISSQQTIYIRSTFSLICSSSFFNVDYFASLILHECFCLSRRVVFSHGLINKHQLTNIFFS